MPRPRKTKKEKEKSPPKSVQIGTRLTKSEMLKMDKICKLDNKTKADVLRDAFNFYAEKHEKSQLFSTETKLEKRLASIENACRALMVKDIKLSAQNLFWLTLLWTYGPPPKKTTEEGFKKLWTSSEQYAAEILKSKKVYMDEPMKPNMPSKSKGK